MPPASLYQSQTNVIDNITTKRTGAEFEIKLRLQFLGVHYALTTHLVIFKVHNDLIAKNISDQNIAINGKQFKIWEYL